MRPTSLFRKFGLVTLGALSAPMALADNPATMIVMDGSGSMWGQIKGRPKLEIARETVAEVLAGLPEDRALGLMAYGHRERGNCADIEVMAVPAKGNATAILHAVNTMKFQGKTPLSEAVRQAAEVLKHSEEAATVVLVTDGIETCHADPCAVAAELEATGVNFTAHVIGFGLTRDEGAQVACLAEATGGRYLPASDAASLADAMRQVVSDSPPEFKPAPEPEPVEESRHYPGDPWMKGFIISPTGRVFGPERPLPAEASFPKEGTPELCRAQCEADMACGSWRFEPGAVMLRDGNACFLLAPGTEFNLTMMPLADGFVSGMKDGVIGLTSPYIPYGASASASLGLTGPVAPGEAFTVLWSGPGLAEDWVDLVPQGHQEIGGEYSYFYVSETIEPGDRPDGAGTLTAPAEPGLYDLRYVMGRTHDRRVLQQMTIGIGVETPDQPPAMGVLIPVRISPPSAYAGQPIWWSAIPLDPRPEAPEAVAPPEAITGAWAAELPPGRWKIEGESADGLYFAADVVVTEAADQAFEIPVGFESEGMGEDPPPAPLSGRPHKDAETGLSVLLPDGWRITEAYFAETAGGVRADQPTATFVGPDGEVLALNPLQWLASNGPCLDSPLGPLCQFGEDDGALDGVKSLILASLSLAQPAPDFGGEIFAPQGDDPISKLVPGWSAK